jgi:hypothetical protein
MKHYPHHTFADLRDAIFAPPPAKRARGGRTDTWVSGQPGCEKGSLRAASAGLD